MRAGEDAPGGEGKEPAFSRGDVLQIKLAEDRLAARTGLPGLIALAVTLVLIGAQFYRGTPTHVFAIWTGLASVVTLVFIGSTIAFNVRNPDAVETERYWSPFGDAMAVALGVVYAATVLLFFPYADRPQQMVITVILAGILLVQMGISPARIVSVEISATITFVSAAWVFYASGDTYGRLMALMALVYVVLLWFIGVTMRHFVRQTFAARIHNDRIAERLGAQTQELRNALAEAEQARDDRLQFLASMSHDIRQPLQAAMTYVALARTQPVQGDAAAHLVGADKALSSAADLLAQILAFIQLDAGRMPYAIKPVALADVLAEAAGEFEPRCRAGGLDLRIAPTSLWVDSDPTHLRRIVRNYLSNAVEHARARRILAGVRRRGRMLRIIIADDGRGVPEGSREAIFEDFARVVREGEPAAAGIGLGLAVVRRSARLLGHAYGVISKPGCGSAFWVEAPRCRAPTTVDSIVQSRRATSLRVLVIEDSAPTAHGLSLLLGAFGHDVRYAHGVEEAVSVIDGWRPDAILADYRLKGEETGVEAIETIRRTLAGDLPAIIITGEGSPQVMAAIDKIGAPVLHKPVAPAVLRAALEHIAAPD